MAGPRPARSPRASGVRAPDRARGTPALAPGRRGGADSRGELTAREAGARAPVTAALAATGPLNFAALAEPGAGGAAAVDGSVTRRRGDGTEVEMRIRRSASEESMAGPAEWFTGAVYLDWIATPSEPSRLQAASVHFAPGARTAWHTHPLGQTIYVTEGVGRCQRRGGPV